MVANEVESRSSESKVTLSLFDMVVSVAGLCMICLGGVGLFVSPTTNEPINTEFGLSLGILGIGLLLMYAVYIRITLCKYK